MRDIKQVVRNVLMEQVTEVRSGLSNEKRKKRCRKVDDIYGGCSGQSGPRALVLGQRGSHRYTNGSPRIRRRVHIDNTGFPTNTFFHHLTQIKNTKSCQRDDFAHREHMERVVVPSSKSKMRLHASNKNCPRT